MAENWQVGDLAECIDVGLMAHLGIGPRHGGIYLRLGMLYTVARVEVVGGIAVLEVGAKGGGKLAARFRKVPPIGSSESAGQSEPRGRELVDG